jgi:hypothetical protein
MKKNSVNVAKVTLAQWFPIKPYNLYGSPYNLYGPIFQSCNFIVNLLKFGVLMDMLKTRK